MVKTKCEVYSRIVGYMRPIDDWNAGKRQEFKDRVNYDATEKVYNEGFGEETGLQVGDEKGLTGQ